MRVRARQGQTGASRQRLSSNMYSYCSLYMCSYGKYTVSPSIVVLRGSPRGVIRGGSAKASPRDAHIMAAVVGQANCGAKWASGGIIGNALPPNLFGT